MKRVAEIIWLDSVDSTSDEIRRRIPALRNLSVIAAREQTAGRGQRGNKWLTRPGENITLSMYIRPGEDGIPAIKARDAFRLTACAALSVAEYVASKGVRCSVKWPNDIYCGDRKVCGMLIESSITDGHISEAILGIGVNLNQTAFPPEILNPTSLKRLTGSDYDIRLESDLLVDILLKNLRNLDTANLLDIYTSKLYRLNEFNSYSDNQTGEQFEARILGINDDGKLLLATRNGLVKSFSFKEISYII